MIISDLKEIEIKIKKEYIKEERQNLLYDNLKVIIYKTEDKILEVIQNFDLSYSVSDSKLKEFII